MMQKQLREAKTVASSSICWPILSMRDFIANGGSTALAVENDAVRFTIKLT
jgi:hypothetical protein